jgi:hypothetical protein
MRGKEQPMMTMAQYAECVQHILAADLHLNTVGSHVLQAHRDRVSEAFTLVRLAMTVLMERLAADALLCLEPAEQDALGDLEEALAYQRLAGARPGLTGHAGG